MSRQIIDTVTNNGSYIGDPSKTAFDKTNANFAELYQLFQTAANMLGYFDSNGKPAFTSLTQFARSILANSDQAGVRSTLGLGSAALAPVIGTVSQADNSALMERSAASSGTYFRFRSGVQICFSFAITANPITSSFGSLFRSPSVNWVFPAQFGGEQPPMVFAQDQFEAIWCGCSQGSYTSSNINSIYPISTSGDRSLYACAIGRWY